MNKKEKLTITDDANAMPSAHTNTRPQQLHHVRRIQNFLLVWLDASIDGMNNEDCINTITKLREVVNTVKTFTDANECINFISDIKEEKTFIISSGAFGQTTVPIVHDMPQVSSIYVFCGNKTRHEQWAKDWPKVKGVFTDIKPICEALKQSTQQCDHNSVSISFVAPSSGTTNQNLDQLDQSFMYTQILKEILLTIDYKQQHIDDFILYCREQLAGNIKELKNVDKLQREYHKQVPIWWYTYHCFLYSMLNRALRTMEVDLIINMGFFVRDLCKDIAQLHVKQYAGYTHAQTFTVYRGQGLCQTDFDQLMKMKGGLLSFNNFLSTSLDREVSLDFAFETIETSSLIGILFVIKIDPSVSSTPFANIRDVGCYPGEEEILFSMHSIFRIGQIKQIDKNSRLWQVDLSLTCDNDPQMCALTERIRKETYETEKGRYRLGVFLKQLGEFDKAQQVFEVMLDQTISDFEKARIYYQLGWIRNDQRRYEEAISFYKKSLEIKQKILPPTHPDFGTTYGSIGLVYENMKEYSKARSYHEKALQMNQEAFPSDHPHLATLYDNMGKVLAYLGEYSKALSCQQQALDIRQKSLPSYHPQFGCSYNNIALVYSKMGNHSMAVSFYERALDIGQRSLPANHPHLQIYKKNVEEEKQKL